jgi:hypothetical protein
MDHMKSRDRKAGAIVPEDGIDYQKILALERNRRRRRRTKTALSLT